MRGEGEKLGWKVICKHKQHTGKNMFKVRHKDIKNYPLTQQVYR